MLRDIDLKYENGVITTTKSLSVGGDLTVGGSPLAPPNVTLPQDHGVIAWNSHPSLNTTSSTAVNGRIYLTRFAIRSAATVSKVWWCHTTGPTTPTAGQNFAGLYDSSGMLLSSVNVDSATGSGPQSATLASAQNIAANSYVWMALMFNAATPPTLLRAAGLNAAANSFNQSPATYGWAVNGNTAGLTALPASITPASNSLTGVLAIWGALS